MLMSPQDLFYNFNEDYANPPDGWSVDQAQQVLDDWKKELVKVCTGMSSTSVTKAQCEHFVFCCRS